MVLSHGTKVSFPLLTCRTSFDGSTMTKLSGKKPRRPFSSPSHQPSSSVSLTVRLNSRVSGNVCGDVQMLHRRLADGQDRFLDIWEFLLTSHKEVPKNVNINKHVMSSDT